MKHSQSLSSILLIFALLFATKANAGDHDEHHHGHEHGSLEAGLSNTLVYSLSEQHFAYGLHVHSIYTFAESSFALGLGYELVAGEHIHHTVGPVLCYRPTDPLNLCVAPGATFGEDEIFFTAHTEITYEFNIYGLHLGPTMGFAYSEEDMHLSLGLHTGIVF